MKKFLNLTILCFLSGLSGIFIFPPFKLWFLAWSGLAPIMLIISKNETSTGKIASGFISGLVFYGLSLYWISSVSGMFYLLLAGYLALFWSIFFWLLFSFPGRMQVIIGAGLWYFLEIIVQHLFTGFPWLPLALSQWSFPSTVLIASLTGTAGLSALIIAMNISIYIALKDKKFYPLLLCGLVVVAFVGVSKAIPVKISENNLKIMAIQGNAGYFGQEPEESFMKYYSITDSIKGKPDLVIWPESSYPSVLNNNYSVLKILVKKSFEFPILMGTLIEIDNSIYNSAVLFNGPILLRYDKNHLVPFGEYVPGRKYKFVREIYKNFAGQLPSVKPGCLPGLFKLDSTKFSVLICFENIFPYLVQNNMKYNPDFLITITNDSWYGRSFSPYQHFAHNILRAVESGRTVIQVSTSGVTGFASPDGFYTTFKKDGQELFVSGTMEINLLEEKIRKTVYSIAGEAGISIIFVLLTGICLCKN